eukprot:TRINITY_DN445_c0_g1_i1.p1 TRINITY_DN445_c0_g1~~TRINITY_DN445_c0_g1_i1.p1  ORF type:complete len:819 (-),score=68.37 TRINITY_DN445_c0_g1_i1:1754-4210(-)
MRIYQDIIKNWTEVTEKVKTIPRAHDLALLNGKFAGKVKIIQDSTHKLQVSLSIVLDKVIMEFPRLILQPLLHKYLKLPLEKLATDLGYVFLFKSLEIKDETKVITGLKNQEGEIFPLKTPIITTGKTTITILKEIEKEMRVSLKSELKSAVSTYSEKEQQKWCRASLLQCVKVAKMLHWTSRVEQAMKSIDSKALSSVLASIKGELIEFVKACKTAENTKEYAIATQMLQVIYWTMDVTQSLIDRMIMDTQAYDWQKCLRYYWYEGDCIVRCDDSAVLYGYELLGKSGTLVWTPETNQAFTQLMSSLRTNACSSIIGGTGSGKADMVVDLAKALGRFYHLIDVTKVVRTKLNIYASHCAAATYAGGFAIFHVHSADENFIALTEVLEKIASASMMGYKEYTLAKCGNLPLLLSPKFALVTCVSPGIGPAKEWIEKTRATFRAIHVQPPDQKLITAYTLYSYGFEKGGELGFKIVKAFQLFAHRFSKVPYYDHSLRSILGTVSLMQSLKKSLSPKALTEEQLAVRSLVSFVKTRLLSKDVETFHSIINELFSKVDISDTYDEKLINGIKEVCKKERITMNEALLNRVYELLELLQLKGPCFVAIGYHGSGKTTSCRVLAKLMNELNGGKNKVQVIEVKHEVQDKYEELFYETTASGKFKPGKILKAILDAREGNNKWVILKGPLTVELQEFLIDLMQGKLVVKGAKVEIHSTNKVIIEESDANNQLIRPAFASRCCFLAFDPKVHHAKYSQQQSFNMQSYCMLFFINKSMLNINQVGKPSYECFGKGANSDFFLVFDVSFPEKACCMLNSGFASVGTS